MIRREFLSAAAAVGAAAVVPAATMRAATARTRREPSKGFSLKYAPHFGMFSNHAKDDLDQLSFAADQGFRAWEDNGMKGRGAEFQTKFAQRADKLGIAMGIFVAQSIDWSNPTLTTGDRAIQDKFVKETEESTEVAARVNATWVTTVVGRVAQNLPWGHQFANVVETLKRAADAIEKRKSSMVMTIEPLNWRDHPGQFCATSDTLRAVCKAVASPHLKILQDLYHLQVTEGNLIDNMDRSWDEIAYIQLGDNPGRCEPGTGEVNYRNVFKHIRERKFTGILGMEHGNSQDGKPGEQKVIEAYRQADAG